MDTTLTEDIEAEQQLERRNSKYGVDDGEHALDSPPPHAISPMPHYIQFSKYGDNNGDNAADTLPVHNNLTPVSKYGGGVSSLIARYGGDHSERTPSPAMAYRQQGVAAKTGGSLNKSRVSSLIARFETTAKEINEKEGNEEEGKLLGTIDIHFEANDVRAEESKTKKIMAEYEARTQHDGKTDESMAKESKMGRITFCGAIPLPMETQHINDEKSEKSESSSTHMSSLPTQEDSKHAIAMGMIPMSPVPCDLGIEEKKDVIVADMNPISPISAQTRAFSPIISPVISPVISLKEARGSFSLADTEDQDSCTHTETDASESATGGTSKRRKLKVQGEGNEQPQEEHVANLHTAVSLDRSCDSQGPNCEDIESDDFEKEEMELLNVESASTPALTPDRYASPFDQMLYMHEEELMFSKEQQLIPENEQQLIPENEQPQDEHAANLHTAVSLDRSCQSQGPEDIESDDFGAVVKMELSNVDLRTSALTPDRCASPCDQMLYMHVEELLFSKEQQLIPENEQPQDEHVANLHTAVSLDRSCQSQGPEDIESDDFEAVEIELSNIDLRTSALTPDRCASPCDPILELDDEELLLSMAMEQQMISEVLSDSLASPSDHMCDMDDEEILASNDQPDIQSTLSDRHASPFDQMIDVDIKELSHPSMTSAQFAPVTLTCGNSEANVLKLKQESQQVGKQKSTENIESHEPPVAETAIKEQVQVALDRVLVAIPQSEEMVGFALELANVVKLKQESQQVDKQKSIENIKSQEPPVAETATKEQAQVALDRVAVAIPQSEEVVGFALELGFALEQKIREANEHPNESEYSPHEAVAEKIDGSPHSNCEPTGALKSPPPEEPVKTSSTGSEKDESAPESDTQSGFHVKEGVALRPELQSVLDEIQRRRAERNAVQAIQEQEEARAIQEQEEAQEIQEQEEAQAIQKHKEAQAIQELEIQHSKTVMAAFDEYDCVMDKLLRQNKALKQGSSVSDTSLGSDSEIIRELIIDLRKQRDSAIDSYDVLLEDLLSKNRQKTPMRGDGEESGADRETVSVEGYGVVKPNDRSRHNTPMRGDDEESGATNEAVARHTVLRDIVIVIKPTLRSRQNTPFQGEPEEATKEPVVIKTVRSENEIKPTPRDQRSKDETSPTTKTQPNSVKLYRSESISPTKTTITRGYGTPEERQDRQSSPPKATKSQSPYQRVRLSTESPSPNRRGRSKPPLSPSPHRSMLPFVAALENDSERPPHIVTIEVKESVDYPPPNPSGWGEIWEHDRPSAPRSQQEAREARSSLRNVTPVSSPEKRRLLGRDGDNARQLRRSSSLRNVTPVSSPEKRRLLGRDGDNTRQFRRSSSLRNVAPVSSPEKRRLLGRDGDNTRQLRRQLDLARLATLAIRNNNQSLSLELDSFKRKLWQHRNCKRGERDILEACHLQIGSFRRRMKEKGVQGNEPSGRNVEQNWDEFSDIQGAMLSNLELMQYARGSILGDLRGSHEEIDEDSERLREVVELMNRIEDRELVHRI